MIFFALTFAIAAGQTGGTTDLLPLEQARIQEYKKVQDIRDQILAKDPFAGPGAVDMQTNPQIKAMGLDGKIGEQQLETALGYRFDPGVLTGYKPVDAASDDPILKSTISRTDTKGAPVFESLKQGLSEMKLGVYEVKVTDLPAASASVSVNTPPATTNVYVGVLDREDLENGLAYGQAHQPASQPYKVTTKILEDTFIPVRLYDNNRGQLLAVLQKDPPQPLIFPETPEFGVYKETPAEVKSAYTANQMKSMKSQVAEWGVQEPEGIVSLEHLRRKVYFDLQKLEQQVKDAHPAETSDFPPEMLQTPEFLATGLRMDNQQDEMILFQALMFKPEGSLLKGYRPIDFGKDKAAGYSLLMTKDGTKLMSASMKDMFDGKSVYLFKLRAQSTKPNSPPPAEFYYGPANNEQMAAIEKYSPDVKITELKDEDIPLTVYTNDAGAVAFVMGFRPKDVLLIPARPSIYVFDEPLAKLAPVVTGAPDAQKVMQSLHQVLPDYAIAQSAAAKS